MAVMLKIIVYGRYQSGKYALALQLMHDNPFLGEPVIINNPHDMKRFLASHRSSVGIVYASNVHSIMGKSSAEKFGSVLFVAAPGEINVTEKTQIAEGPRLLSGGPLRLISPATE